MTRQRLRDFFNRYTSGTLSPAERAEFFSAISQAEHDQELNKLIEEIWVAIPANDSSELAELFQKLPLTQPKRDETIFRPWLKVAATVTAVLISSAALYLVMDGQTDSEKSFYTESPTPAQVSFVRLPDGSTVVLNNGSNLDFPPSFDNQKTRMVTLRGEAFFDIKHDETKPFIVRAGEVTTTVLGTAFNVKALPGDNEVTVTVSRGKVKVSAENKVMGVLTRDQQLTVKNGKLSKSQLAPAREATAWMESDISFDNTTLKDALDELADRFQVQIKLVDAEAYDCRFTGSFANGETLEQILFVLGEFNNVKVRDAGPGIFEVSGTGCNGIPN